MLRYSVSHGERGRAPAQIPGTHHSRTLPRGSSTTGRTAACRPSFRAIASTLLVATASLLANVDFVRASPPDLTLICPTGTAAPSFHDAQTGSTHPITNPELEAVAEKACNPTPPSATESTRVVLANNRETAIFVGFTTNNHKPGPINWGAGCTKLATGAMILPGTACAASVVANAVPSRFCAALNKVPVDCFDAQANRQTMIETIFEPAGKPGCFNKGRCVWFDISVIPPTCTDALWKSNRCAKTGGASYNLPVSLACSSNIVYTCQGPRTDKYGPANYPSNCGDPAATCQNGPNCQNAYFYPMFVPPENKYQPSSVCLGGQPLVIRFLPGS
jgi:hypothetical protein